MDPKTFKATILDTALPLLETLANIKVTPEAQVLVMTVAGQESDWAARLQHGGPARSYWQFEGAGGGVGELFAVTPKQLAAVCTYLDIPYDRATVFEAMAWNDTLACCMARLLVWQDPASLPAVGDEQGAWDYYDRNWRPGAPDRQRWTVRYASAMEAIK